MELFEDDLDAEENEEDDEDLIALEALLEDDTESEDYEELPPETEEEEGELNLEDVLEEENEGEEDEDEEEEQYDFDELFASDETEEEAGDDEDGFDVMKMLRMEAKAIVEQKKSKPEQDVELSDYAEEGGVADITLEDLAKIVAMQRKKKRTR